MCPVVMYRRTGATLSTLKIIRYRHYYNNIIQQILNSILGYIYIHILFILCIAVSFGILEDQQKSCNRISHSAFDTTPTWPDRKCMYFKN